MAFKENLRSLREQAGLTQTEMAGKARVPFRSYQNWETGLREPRIDALAALAKALGVTIDELVGGGNDSPKKPPSATPSTPLAGEQQRAAKKARGQTKKRK